MPSRITRADLETAATNLERLLHARNLIASDERLILSIGSKTYGQAYRLNLGKPGSHAHFTMPIGAEYLGMTASEAHDAITTRCRIISDVFYVLERGVQS